MDDRRDEFNDKSQAPESLTVEEKLEQNKKDIGLCDDIATEKAPFIEYDEPHLTLEMGGDIGDTVRRERFAAKEHQNRLEHVPQKEPEPQKQELNQNFNEQAADALTEKFRRAREQKIEREKEIK